MWQDTSGPVLQVKEMTTFFIAIHPIRKYPNPNAYKNGIRRCWTRHLLRESFMTTRFATVCLLNYFDGLFICIFLKAFEQQCYLGNWGQCSPFAFLLSVFFGKKSFGEAVHHWRSWAVSICFLQWVCELYSSCSSVNSVRNTAGIPKVGSWHPYSGA